MQIATGQERFCGYVNSLIVVSETDTHAESPQPTVAGKVQVFGLFRWGTGWG